MNALIVSSCLCSVFSQVGTDNGDSLRVMRDQVAARLVQVEAEQEGFPLIGTVQMTKVSTSLVVSNGLGGTIELSPDAIVANSVVVLTQAETDDWLVRASPGKGPVELKPRAEVDGGKLIRMVLKKGARVKLAHGELSHEFTLDWEEERHFYFDLKQNKVVFVDKPLARTGEECNLYVVGWYYKCCEARWHPESYGFIDCNDGVTSERCCN